jgi:hypothetical protein
MQWRVCKCKKEKTPPLEIRKEVQEEFIVAVKNTSQNMEAN